RMCNSVKRFSDLWCMTHTFSFSEENQRLLLTHPDVNVQLPMLLSSDVPEIQKQSLALLSLYSQTENGRNLLIRHQNLTKYLPSSFSHRTFCTLLLFHHYCPERFFSLLLFLKKTVKQVNQPALAQCIAIMGDLCADVVIRLQMAESQECWQAYLGASAIIFIFFLLIQRAVGVLSHILPGSSMAVEEAVKGGVVKRLLKFLKAGGQTTSNYAMKALAVCTQCSSQAREEVVKADKKFDILLKLLASENEMVVGNAAFCLGKCFDVPGAASCLLNSNIVMVLLKHAGGEANITSVQENAAVALGKLCTSEPRYYGANYYPGAPSSLSDICLKKLLGHQALRNSPATYQLES
uniref:Uncharacterized protein n=1 Tax=Pelusios castaneus TaxID=367368 RepID=A0A8C8VKN8_9SAUR